jgi:hypothetical protein
MNRVPREPARHFDAIAVTPGAGIYPCMRTAPTRLALLLPKPARFWTTNAGVGSKQYNFV